MIYREVISILLLAMAVVGMGCSGQSVGEKNGNQGGSSMSLQGSGSTFVKPIMDKWTSEFGKINATSKIDYQGGGSGAGRPGASHGRGQPGFWGIGSR